MSHKNAKLARQVIREHAFDLKVQYTKELLTLPLWKRIKVAFKILKGIKRVKDEH